MADVNALSAKPFKAMPVDPNLDPYGFQSVLPQGTTVKMLQDSVSKQAEPERFGFSGVSSASDPLVSFLNKGIQETPEALKDRYTELFDAGHYGFRQPSSMGMDKTAVGALNDKIRSGLTSRLGVSKTKLLNQAPADFAQRQGVYQGLADANVRRVMGIEAQSSAAREAAKQKRSALTSGLLGLGGTAAGAAVGGPAGAAIGGGLGSTAGGLF